MASSRRVSNSKTNKSHKSRPKAVITGKRKKKNDSHTAVFRKKSEGIKSHSKAAKMKVQLPEIVKILKPVREEINKIIERFSVAAQAAQLGIWDWDVKNNILVWDDAMYKLYGIHKEDFTGAYDAWLNGLHPDDRIQSHLEIQRVLRGEKEYDYEFRIVLPGGTIRYIKAHGNVIRDINGKPLRMIGVNYDITKRKYTEKALKESEERYRILFERSIEGIGLSKGNMVIDANKALLDIFGYNDLEEFKNIPLLDHIAPESRRMVENKMRIIGRTDHSEKIFEYRILRKDGEKRDLEISLEHIPIGDELFTLSSFRDITNRKAAEKALKESEEKFRTFAEQSPNMIFINIAGKIVYANAKCEEIMGYTKEEFYSPDFNFPKITAPEYVELLKGYFQRHLKGEDVPAHEYAILTKHGKRLDVIITTKLIPYENKKAILGIITDITDRRRANSLLLENQEAINAIIQTSQDWIWSIDIRGIHTYSNPAVEKILGYKPEEIIGKGSLELLHGDDKKMFQSLLSDCMQKCTGWNNLILRWLHKNGTYHYMESNAVPILNNKGDLIGFRGVDRDITERKQIEIYIEKISDLKKELLNKRSITEKLKLVSNSIVEIFNADFARIWMIKQADLCEKGCFHASVTEGLDVCRDRTRCLHLISSSGRYTHIDGNHRRVPFGCYKIGRVASGEDDKFITNDVIADTRVHDHEWARSIGLVSFVGFKITSENGSPIGVMALFRNKKIEHYEEKYLEDIASTISQVILAGTAEDALIESEARFRALIESQNDLISRYRPDTVLTFVNDAYCQFYGRTREELIGHSFLEMVAPEFREEVLREAEMIVKDPRPVKGEYLNYRQDGGECWIQWVIQGIVDENGNVVELQAVGRDITERKQMEEKLIESEEHFRTFIENASVGACLVGLDNKFINVNHAMCEFTGYSEDELHQLTFTDITHVDDRSASSDHVSRLLSGEMKKFSFEKRYKHKSGQTIWGLVSSSLIRDHKGNPKYFVTHVQDITERKRLEEELFQSQKMLSIGTLAGGIAHDFNNILGIILGYAQLLENHRADDKKYSDSIAAINQTIQRGASLVRQILTFARKTDVEFELINIIDIVRELFSMLRQTFPRVISFIEEFERDIPCIYADHTQIHQALLNLCVNARDAMPNGGTIAITAERRPLELVQLRFPAADQDSYICISVSDTGEGMDESTRLRIFDPFFTTKPIGKGTGMGLPVVYGIVHAHHGFIDLESRLGHGTTFHLYFPIIKGDIKKKYFSRKRDEYNIGGTETILIVEDEVLLIEMVRNMLESKGYKVYCAQDGLTAIDLYRQHKDKIALILTDMGLPELTGINEFKRLKDINPDIKVIFASGFFEPDVKSELLKAGAKGFIQKPYESNDILRTVRDVLDKK